MLFFSITYNIYLKKGFLFLAGGGGGAHSFRISLITCLIPPMFIIFFGISYFIYSIHPFYPFIHLIHLSLFLCFFEGGGGGGGDAMGVVHQYFSRHSVLKRFSLC